MIQIIDRKTGRKYVNSPECAAEGIHANGFWKTIMMHYHNTEMPEGGEKEWQANGKSSRN